MTPARREVQAHLKRLAAWAVVSILAGIVIGQLGQSDPVKGAGSMTFWWAVVNLFIALPGLRKSEQAKPVEIPKLREVLYLNQGLNLGYVGVGLTMALGIPGWAQGGGWAIVVQGLGLFVLDSLLLRRSPASSAVESAS
jgi:hypothetical protein